jgi:EmrB/QacA subfamily drug resistance transporter
VERETRRGGVLAVACAAQFMVVLDVTIVNVALPSVQHSLGFSATQLQWVLNAYALAFGGFLLLGGRAGDFLGRRRMLLIGMGLFALASLLGGIAQTPGQLIAARAVQGFGGALLSPATLAVINTTFEEGKERTRAVGIWSAVGGAGGAIGVLVGGLLTDLIGWRWVLLINVPMALVVVAGCVLASVPEGKRVRTSLDLLGAALGTAGFVVLVYGVVRTDTFAWGSWQTVATLAGSVVLLALFALVELKLASAPVFRFGLLASRSVGGGNVVALLVGGSMIASFYFVSLYLQGILHWSPLITGVSFLPFSVGIFGGTIIATKLLPTAGPRPLLMGGALLAAIGSVWFSTADVDGTFLSVMLGPSLVTSIGLGICLVSMTVASTSGVPHEEAGAASGLLNTSRQVGGAVGLAVLVTVAANRTHDALGGGSGQVGATVAGYDRAFLVTAGFFVVAAIAALMLPGGVAARRSEPTVADEDAPADLVPSESG